VCLARALKRAKISDFRLHDLRHTFVTNPRKVGVDRTVIMKLTGHKTLSMFTCYNTVDEADAKQAMNLRPGLTQTILINTRKTTTDNNNPFLFLSRTFLLFPYLFQAPQFPYLFGLFHDIFFHFPRIVIKKYTSNILQFRDNLRIL
jgi:hypothetical protein